MGTLAEIDAIAIFTRFGAGTCNRQTTFELNL